MAGLGYAVPEAVIAVGVLVPLGRLDNALAGWLEQAFGMKPGLLLTGTIAALVCTYLVRLLAVSLQTTNAGLAKITPSMEDAARSLGATPRQRCARARAIARAEPRDRGASRVRRCIEGAAGDLRAAAIQLRYAGGRGLQPREGRAPAEAAAPSLALVAAGLLPVIYVSKRYFQATRS